MIEAIVLGASLAISIAIVPLVHAVIQKFKYRKEWQKWQRFIEKVDADKATEVLNSTNLNPFKAARILDDAFQYSERKGR